MVSTLVVDYYTPADEHIVYQKRHHVQQLVLEEAVLLNPET